MRRSISVLVFLLLSTIASRAVHAQDQPVAVLSIKSADRLLTGVGSVGRWLALNGTAEEQQQGEQFIRSMVEPHLANLDQKLPAGAAVWLSPDGMPDVLLFLPMDDATPLLNSIAPLVGQPEQVGEAMKFALPGMPPVFVQTKGSWTYLAMSQQRLDATPADPAALLGALPRLYDIALRLKIQAIPEALRNQLLESATQSLPLLMAPSPGGFEGDVPEGFPGDADFPCTQDDIAGDDGQVEGGIGDQAPLGAPGVDPALRAAIDQQIEALRRFLNETDQLVFGIAIDDVKQELRIDFIQKAVAGSATASLFNGWQTKRPTRYAGFYRPEAGFHAHFNMQLAPETVASLTTQLDGAAKTLLQPEEGGSLSDKAQQEVANTFVNVLKAFVGQGDTDLVVNLSTANVPSLLLAGKVSDVASIHKAIGLAEVALADAPGVTKRKETIGGVPLSVWSFPIPDVPEAASMKKVLGPNLELAAGVAQDNAYIAIGPPGVLQQLEASLGKSTTPIVRSSMPGMLLVDVKKLVGNLDVAGIPGVGEWAAEIAKIEEPMHIRWSTVPSKNAGIYRIQVGAGAFFAFAPRAAASSEGNPPFDDPSGAFE